MNDTINVSGIADTGDLTGKKVLVVEDDPFLHNLLADYLTVLRKRGVVVELVTNGEEALRKARELKPDIMLLDIVLPGKNGFEVLEELRAEEQFKTLPVIIISNLSQPQDIERAKKLGVSEYLVKANFMPNEFVDKIISLISGKQSK